MEAQLTLNPGETVVKRNSEIGCGGSFSRNNNDLILTNQSIILQKKNLFGKVTEGMDTADYIVSRRRDWNDRPLEPQVIKNINVFEEE